MVVIAVLGSLCPFRLNAFHIGDEVAISVWSSEPPEELSIIFADVIEKTAPIESDLLMNNTN